ncbi:hypothetical protein HS7_11550 [Sulfolobales archaeon HS-7]|nr:hypothetical protein HS7_11550 [Sulfolobales archaeon HS-7]
MKSRRESLNKAISRTIVAIIAIIIVAVAAIAIVGFVEPGIFISHKPSVITINYYDDLAPSEAKVFESVVIPMFEKENPNIKINYVDESASDIVSSVESLEEGHDVGPTIIAEDNMVIGELLYGGYLMNITNVSSSIMPSQMIPSMTNLVNYEVKAFHGVFFIPLRANIPLVFYNKTALESAGITQPPSTLQQLLQDAQTLYQKTGIKPVMFQGHGGASTPTELFQWMVQFGGNPMVLNDSGDIQTFQYIYNLSAYFNPDYIHGYWGSYKGLADGSYYILDYQWPYVYPILTGSPPSGLGVPTSSLGVYPGPSGPVNNDHVVGGDVLAIPKGATDLSALVTFAKFLLSEQVQRIFIVDLSWPAVNEQAYANLPSNISTIYQAEEEAISAPVFRPPVPWIDEWNSIVDQVWTQIIVDHAPYSQIPSILSKANAELYNYLKTNYNQTVAQEYEEGYFAPLYG